MGDLTEAQKQSYWRYNITFARIRGDKRQSTALTFDSFLALRSLFTLTTISETKEEQR
jgi:hypothetical protein